MDTRPVGVWLSCFVLVLTCGAAGAADEAAEAPEVPVARPIVREVTDHEDFTGRTEAVQRVDLRARVSGYLLKSHFREGADVKKGDLLFEIDPRPYQAEMDRADAELRRAQAALKVAEARLQRARGQEAEQATAERVEAEARVRVAKAVREVARLNLDFTRVLTPIDGQIGRRLLDPGNLVKADETILATVVSRDPVYVYFDIDERTLLRLRRALNEAGRKAEKVAVFIGLADEKDHPHRGEVNFSDNQVSPETGNLRVRAVLPNQDQLLSPGLFVRVRMAIGAPYRALLVRSEAMLAEEGMKIVYVVNDKNVIERRRVEVGPERDGLRVVRSGLKAEDRVVVGRQQQLRPGKTVRPVEGEQRPAPEQPAPAKPSVKVRPAPRDPGPVLFVEAEYPGASAAVVADTVAAPIEQQVNGVEKALAMRSRCTDDGKYVLAITFARGADPDMCQVLVQNRVALAAPVLPAAVQDAGVTVRKRMPGVRMLVTLLSPGGRFDSVYLSNYARIRIKDELTRLPGVADVTLVGPQEYGLRVWLDTERLAARKLTAAEVVRALKEQSMPVAPFRAPKKGEAFQLELKTEGRLLDPETLADVVLKADPENRTALVRLKDVARVELGANRRDGRASLDGKPAVALAIHTLWGVRPRDLRDAVRAKVRELRELLPDGVELAVSFDLTEDRPAAAEHLLLDLDLPVGASAERAGAMLRRSEALLRDVPGVRHVLALSDNPFDLFSGGPCMLVELDRGPERKVNRAEVARAIRKRLDEIKEMTLRVRDLSRSGAYPVDVAVRGPDAAAVRDFARQLAARLGESKQLTDVAVNTACLPRPRMTVDLDRKRAAALGVSAKDVFDTLQVYLGALPVSDVNRFGRTWRVEVQTRPGSGGKGEDIKKLHVRGAGGEIVSLGTLVSVRETNGPLAIDRLDIWPMVQITANPAAGVSDAQVRALIEKRAGEVRAELRLSAEYGLSWLQKIPDTK